MPLLLGLSGGGAGAQQADPVAGEAFFRRCQPCHQVGEDAHHIIGPILNDLMGRRAAAYPGYRYSLALVRAGKGGLTWTVSTIDAYLQEPRELVPGTSMSFAGITDPEDRANVIAYLMTLSPGYVARD
jgi:cytochrome c